MPRKPREDVAGAIHHVYARGNNQRRIFLDDRDRRRYLVLLEHVVRAKRWLCLAYCLMDNHVHLLVETPEPNLGAGMQLLHGLYGCAHNKRHGCSGHVFQGRFGATRVLTDGQLLMAVGYIARNPVEAALSAEPHGWPWGSHAAIVAGTPPAWLRLDHLMTYFGADGGDPERRYAEAIAPRTD
jgi:REP element-mobilizing transposase RayT